MLNKTYLGQPVVFKNKVYGRIVSLKGSSINHGTLHSIVQFSTPSGTVTETGIFYLEEARENDIRKLKEFEQWQLDNYPNEKMYDGRIENMDISDKGNLPELIEIRKEVLQKYPKFIITFADDVYQFIKENKDGTLSYKTFGGGKLDIKPEEIGVKYRQIK